jgi:hypothetical protein
MSSVIQDILRRIYRPPINVNICPADYDKHYKPWGFTLYRTCYAPESNQQWKLLVDKISTTVLATLSEYNEKDEGDDSHNIAIISEHFRLDALSNPATLDGLTMDKVSQIHRSEVGDSPMEMRNSLTPDHQIFLLADGEVLQSLDSGVLKVVQAAPIGADLECFYQWMTVEVELLIDSWIALEICDSGLYDLIWEEQPGLLWTG